MSAMTTLTGMETAVTSVHLGRLVEDDFQLGAGALLQSGQLVADLVGDLDRVRAGDGRDRDA